MKISKKEILEKFPTKEAMLKAADDLMRDLGNLTKCMETLILDNKELLLLLDASIIVSVFSAGSSDIEYIAGSEQDLLRNYAEIGKYIINSEEEHITGDESSEEEHITSDESSEEG